MNLLGALGGAILGRVIAGGLEAAKALYREVFTDPQGLKRIGAKALNGAIFGALASLLPGTDLQHLDCFH
jgi:hypothetical protein